VPSLTNVFFVRHAESQANLDRDEIAHGWRDAYPRSLQDERDADLRLTARGVEQARVTGRYLAANLDAFDACYVSPWLRTRHTFDHLLAAYPAEQRDTMRAATRYEERLRDYEQGIVTRLTHAQIVARYPEEARRRATDGPYYYRPAGGESWADISQRLAPVLDALARASRTEDRYVELPALLRQLNEELSLDQVSFVLDVLTELAVLERSNDDKDAHRILVPLFQQWLKRNPLHS